MITILHGNDTTESRKYFLLEKQKLAGLLLDADQVNLTDLTQVFEGGGLFGESKHIFIEHFLTKRKKSSDFPALLVYLQKNAVDNTILLWEGKELDRTTINSMKNAVIKSFQLPQTLFQLLDALKPGNTKILVSLFHKTIQTTEPEMVFFMLVRQCRLLLALSPEQNLDTKNVIDEIKRLGPWQQSKMLKQAKLFSYPHLFSLYQKLFQIEIGQKTGKLSAPLTITIDFFLLEV